jgi:4-hydroxybenzoate polyprenyltransferase
LCVGALWLYSTTYKRKLLIGNLLISLLTAWTILILYVVNVKSWLMVKVMGDYRDNYNHAVTNLFKLAILYAGFAFISSLIREVIKDMEDMEGDARYGCRTMPIVWGIPVSKVFTAVWIAVLIAALVIVQFYVLHFGWWLSSIYGFLGVILPLLWLIRGLYRAKTPKDYHRLSTAIKLVMLAGIISISFFYWYY